MQSTRWSQTELNLLTREYQKGTSMRRISELLESLPSGNLRSYNSIEKQVRNLRVLRKYDKFDEGLKVGHLDIESSQLNASFGMIITWNIKKDGEDVIIGDRLTPRDFRQKDKLSTDKRVVQSLVNELEKYDIVTHFFGSLFDIPFIRSRCLKHGILFPEYGSMVSVDVWRWCKRNLKLHSHRLESVAGHLGVNSKTKLDPDTWIRATMGDTEAIEEVYEHNRQDVITLEKVYHILKRYSSGSRSAI